MIHPKEAKELLYRMFEDHYVSLTVSCPWAVLSRLWFFRVTAQKENCLCIIVRMFLS